MIRIDQKAAYELLDVLGGLLGDIRSTLQDFDSSDVNSVFDVRRDCHIRIQNIEGKLKELKKTVGPDPLARPSVLDEHPVTLSEQKADDLRHRLLVTENACGDVRTRLDEIDALSNLPADWKTAYDDMRERLAAAVLNIHDVSKELAGL